MYDGEEEGCSPEVRSVQASRGDKPDAARRGDAGGLQEKEAGGDVSLRFLPLPGAGLGWAEFGAGARRGDSGPARPTACRNPRRTGGPWTGVGHPRPTVLRRVRMCGSDRPAQGLVTAV